ncbi:MAG TPA: hypothetical protein VJ622_12705 [Acidimicrobiia bacterium]|nr:hypothetical protein [Acidimicrobiia bacterium]
MRRAVMLVAAAAMVIAAGSPAGATDSRYRHHDRYRGDYYDYPEHHEPYSEDGPYDGYYDCRRSPGPHHHPETWCDHYWGRRSEG